MNKIYFAILLISSFIYSQTTIKTYYDPLYKTKIKEVYQVKNNTNILNGNYKQYDQYGYLLTDKNFINNKTDGKSINYFGANEASLMNDITRLKCLGKISGVFNYKNDVLDGIQLQYHYTDQGDRFLLTKEVYKNGVEIEYILYFPNNQIKKQNNLNGECFGYYENGNKYDNFFLKNGKYEGDYTSWFESGKLKVKGFFINDKKNGEWLEYNEDGTILLKEQYDLGKKLPTEEEKIAIALKLKEEQELTEQKVKNTEIERIKKIEEDKEKIDGTKLNKLMSDYDMNQELVTTKYRYWGGSEYEFKKENLFKAYSIVVKYLSFNLNDKNKRNGEKIEFANIGVNLTNKMIDLIDENTKDLEKSLKKVENADDIIKILELK